VGKNFSKNKADLQGARGRFKRLIKELEGLSQGIGSATAQTTSQLTEEFSARLRESQAELKQAVRKTKFDAGVALEKRGLQSLVEDKVVEAAEVPLEGRVRRRIDGLLASLADSMLLAECLGGQAPLQGWLGEADRVQGGQGLRGLGRPALAKAGELILRRREEQLIRGLTQGGDPQDLAKQFEEVREGHRMVLERLEGLAE
jgi:hypothetical protein